MKVFLAIAISMALFWPCLSYSQDDFMMYGTNFGCGIITRDTDPSKDIMLNNYLSGFISGSNYRSKRITHQSSDDFVAWLIKYCQENPLSNLPSAAINLDRELDK